MRKKDLGSLPTYFDRYITLGDDTDLETALQNSLESLNQLPVDSWTALGDRVYAPEKWTIKDILQHLIDTERIFTYRALCMARKDFEKKPEFDENLFAANGNAGNRNLDDLIQELVVVRKSTIGLYSSFNEEVLSDQRKSFEKGYSVLAIAFIVIGHQIHHFNILEERYYPLLNMLQKGQHIGNSMP